MLYGDVLPTPLTLREGGELEPEIWQEAAISLANTQSTSWPNKLLEKIFDALDQSEIPSLIYVAPIATAMNENEALESYKRVTLAINLLKKQYERKNFIVVDKIPQNVVDSMEFRDHLHLENSGVLPRYLSDLIRALDNTR